jgi:hypothetical protein
MEEEDLDQNPGSGHDSGPRKHLGKQGVSGTKDQKRRRKRMSDEEDKRELKCST